MFDALIEGLFLVLQWKAFSLMLVGMGLGFCVGLLPGIGGAATLALMIPFVFKMSPVEAFAFLLGMHSVAATTGDITSILFGVPGEGLSAATVVDGHPMAKQGEAARALGAALMSSLVGAGIGAAALAVSIPIVRPLVLTFAIPEIIDLAVRRTAIAGDRPAAKLGAGVWQGIRDTFTHFWLVVRCSAVGVFVGILPGAGGGVAQWMAYAHAVQSAKDSTDRARFGGGDVRGVLGPGAANNSKEGGDLVPTIAFGVPGSGAMAILLGGFMIMGLVPGPDMLSKHLAVTYSMVWTLVIANIITVVLSLAVLNQLAKVTYIRGGLIVPFVLLLVFVGSYTANGHLADLIVTFCFGMLGYLMVLWGWPRPPLVLGLVLGKLVETYLFISVSRYGFSWLAHPLVLLLIALMVVVIVYPFVREKPAWAGGGD